MLKSDFIAREELYEAVWTESGLTLAKSLGISDVGLAKICKKLNVPRPGRGYWAKPSGSRKLLKKPLSPLAPDQAKSYRVCLAATEGGPAWTREALKNLAEEGIEVPKTRPKSSSPGIHPLIATYRDLVAASGWGVHQLLDKKTCLAVSVSEPLLNRGLTLLQSIFEALEQQGYQPEVLPPNPHGHSQYGYAQAQPSRTGVRIKGIFVAFEVREDYRTLEVPPLPSPPPLVGKRKPAYEPPPRPTYRNIGSGELVLEIVDPTPHGMRRRWTDGKRRIEDALNSFFRAVMAIAEHQHQEEQERIRKKQAEAEAEARRQEAEARRAELAGRMYDLESRLMDVQQAQAIRTFAQRVRADGQNRGVPPEEGELQEWLRWAEGLADDLERTAVQTFSQRRRASEAKPSYGHQQTQDTEVQLRSEVDLWRRRYIFGRR